MHSANLPHLTAAPGVATQAANLSKLQLQPGDRFIRIKEVQDITSRKKSQIYADPTFPRPIKLSVRESAWLLSQVLAWMQAKLDAAGGNTA